MPAIPPKCQFDLSQLFSNLGMHKNYLMGLSKQIARPHSQSS